MALAIDISNYSDELTDDVVQAWKAAGVGLVLVQAFPASYAQYQEQRRQMRVLARNGLPMDAYVYDYLADPSWLAGALEGLVEARDEEGLFPRQIWLDEEDVTTERGWTTDQRRAAIIESLKQADKLGPPVGIYTGRWWWEPLTNNWTGPADEGRELWDSDYDGNPDAAAGYTPYGGWSLAQRRVKQYAGTSTFEGIGGVDLNVLSLAEEAEMAEPPAEAPAPEPEAPAEPEPIDVPWQAKRELVINTLGLIHGDELDALLKAPNKQGRKDQAARIRALIDQALAA